VASSEGRRVDLLKLHINELETVDEGSVAESAGLYLLDGRVADDHAEDGHRAEGIPAYDLGRNVVHANLRDRRGEHRLG